MKRFGGGLIGGSFGLAVGLLALAGPALGQESLDAGKTPAQLFASDCSLCHKSPQGLAAKAGILGLESFLREHYTASRESAGAIANYLRSVGGPAAPAGGRATTKRSPKGDAAKGDAPKGDTKSGDKPKSGEDAKPTDKSADKPAEGKAAGGESSGGKSGGGKSGGGKGGTQGAKPADAKPADGSKSD